MRPVDEVTTARIRKMAREGKIEMAPQQKIDALDRVTLAIFMLEILGHDVADVMLSDESRLSDFGVKGAMMNARKRYGMKVGTHEKIVDIVSRIKVQRNP